MTAPTTQSTDPTTDYSSDDLAMTYAPTTSRRLPCRVADPDLWFAENPSDLEQAKALCVECPLRRQCLDSALDRGEPWGVWGGEIFSDGVVIARKRPRGRPRKQPVAA